MPRKAKKAQKAKQDTNEILQPKLAELAQLVQKSKHLIVFTGAGISTACGIPDYRSETGVWTMLDAGKEPEYGIEMTAAIPSKAHMAITQLVQDATIHYVISQNCDGLHRRSGVPVNKIAELHGNIYRETCAKCKKEYLRNFDATSPSDDATNHYTGRKCTAAKCKGKLIDSIINFGEDLPEAEFNMAMEHAQKADLCLVLGSSCTVTPASDFPEMVSKKGKLVIVNLQDTPLDDFCALRIYAKCDDVMQAVMSALNKQIPEYKVQ